MNIDPFSRHQPHLRFIDFYPERTDGLCACGCGTKLTGRQTRWATKACMNRASEFYFLIKGHSNTVRVLLWERDKGICAHCQAFVPDNYWEADHIVPVHRGGGGCDLDNYQTLCPDCHKAKTKRER